jgi:hypothetical protein
MVVDVFVSGSPKDQVCVSIKPNHVKIFGFMCGAIFF